MTLFGFINPLVLFYFIWIEGNVTKEHSLSISGYNYKIYANTKKLYIKLLILDGRSEYVAHIS